MRIHHSKTNINDEYHFKEISEHMEEFWRTHIIVPPDENDPPYIVGRIKEIKENLTMEENPITITIDNYCGQKITFTASKDARVETLLSIDGAKVVGFDIDVKDDDILIEKEDLPA